MRLFPLFTVSDTLQLLLIIMPQGTPGRAKVLGAVYDVGGVPRTAPHPSPSPRGEQRPRPWEANDPGPMFDPSPPQTVTALKDDIAYLHCIVHNRGNRTVSWIRASDLHILTVAQYTYTADDRFEVIHSPDSNAQSWVLKINSVQPRDSGRYECQVNTHPTDPITFPVHLAVFVPSAEILGSPERYVDRGSTINLTCIINFNPDSPTEIFWYHNNKVINYDNLDSRVSVITDRGAVTKTTLLIHDAHHAATGIYSCVPSASTTASVRIYILKGETPAAMQTSAANAVCRHLRWQHFFRDRVLLLLLLLLVFGCSSASHEVCLSTPPNILDRLLACSFTLCSTRIYLQHHHRSVSVTQIVAQGNDQASILPRDGPTVARNDGKLLLMTRCVHDEWRERLPHGRRHEAYGTVCRAGDATQDNGVTFFTDKRFSRPDKRSKPPSRIQEYLGESTCSLSTEEAVQISRPWLRQVVFPARRVTAVRGAADHQQQHCSTQRRPQLKL